MILYRRHALRSICNMTDEVNLMIAVNIDYFGIFIILLFFIYFILFLFGIIMQNIMKMHYFVYRNCVSELLGSAWVPPVPEAPGGPRSSQEAHGGSGNGRSWPKQGSVPRGFQRFPTPPRSSQGLPRAPRGSGSGESSLRSTCSSLEVANPR